MKNLHTDLDKYTAQWEKALEKGIFDDAPQPVQPNRELDFFGQMGGEDVPLNECDAKYWDRVYKLSRNTGPGQVPDPLTPLKEETDKTAVKRATDKIANSANPIEPWTVGKDQDWKPTANWTDGKELRELADLKKKLEQLESKMNAQESEGKSGESIQKQIDAMRQKLDDLSDSLSNHRFGWGQDSED